MKKIKWEDVVKMQYGLMQKSSMFFAALLTAFAAFSKVKELSLGFFTNSSLTLALFFVLRQHIQTLELINIQREASYVDGQDNEKNRFENEKRRQMLRSSKSAALFIFLTIFFILFEH